MQNPVTAPHVGIFTRVLDAGSAADRYRKATEQILLAEELGLDTVWVAQHHFHEAEGGLPSPLVFLSHIAARTSRIHVATGIVTLPTEDPVRLAEDAVVLDVLSGGRLQLGVGSGGNPTALSAFGRSVEDRRAIYDAGLATLATALTGGELAGGNRLYPAPGTLGERIWEATFSAEGAERIGGRGNGLLLSRTQPRAPGDDRTTPQIQQEVVAAYRSALPEGVPERILASRSLAVGADRDRLRTLAHDNLSRLLTATGQSLTFPTADPDQLLAWHDVHVGTVEEVTASLTADPILAEVTDIAFQVHPVDPPHEDTLESIRLIAGGVAPALGWVRSAG
ncbi:putative FMN-dependent luciferase-like monooxygenase [Planctomonas psychrotolerans]|uniref:putative FMN-dependent luciferase-like monooxygenase n=1 Tax=Planctomonas psychrotolerans TaxID=2528712 RepID=UPI00123C12CA|nr:putative FMN-dependent luciferase-like monooxygenase [Planctomonas psychrotolerans]